MATSDDAHKYPEHMHGKILRGKVLAAGPGDSCKRCHGERGGNCNRCDGTGRLPMHVKAGDVILYPHRQCDVTGETITRDGKKYLLIHEEQWAIGVVEG